MPDVLDPLECVAGSRVTSALVASSGQSADPGVGRRYEALSDRLAKMEKV